MTRYAKNLGGWPPWTPGYAYASWCGKNNCETRYSLFLLAVSEYKWLYTSLYFIITDFHTELKPQVKVSHYMNSPMQACTTQEA